jgi:hypothetical protein
MWHLGRGLRLLIKTVFLSRDVEDKTAHLFICGDTALYLKHLKRKMTGTQEVEWVTDAIIIPLIE